LIEVKFKIQTGLKILGQQKEPKKLILHKMIELDTLIEFEFTKKHLNADCFHSKAVLITTAQQSNFSLFYLFSYPIINRKTVESNFFVRFNPIRAIRFLISMRVFMIHKQ